MKKSDKTRLPGWNSKFLASLGQFRTIIDVGVMSGTAPLYEAFPKAHLILVEPQPDCAQACAALLSGRNGEVHIVAAGDRDGTVELNIRSSDPSGSSIFRRLDAVPTRTIIVPMRRLDTLFANRAFDHDVILKADVEGAEMLVIKGAKATLRQVGVCIIETRIAQRYEQSYKFTDLVLSMRSNGFELFDVLTVSRPRDGRPGARVMDAVFSKQEQRAS